MTEAREIKLIAFDMDGVLTTETSSWNYVHTAFGVSNSSNWKKYEEGKISYLDFLKSDVSLWLEKYGEVREIDVLKVLDRIGLKDGLAETICNIRERDIRTVIISGGIYWLAERINEIAPFDDIYANSILVDHSGFLIDDGFVLVDPKKKGEVLQGIQNDLGIGYKNTMAIGDSDLDISMFNQAAYSVAFNPTTEKITEHSGYVVFGQDLRSLIEIIDKLGH